MLTLSGIKVGKKIIIESEPFVVLFAQHSKMGRAGAVLRTKLKNLVTGATINKTFQGADKIPPAEITTQKAQYLYSDEQNHYFMNGESYEQFEISAKVIGDNSKFLTEGTEIDVLYFGDSAINIELPIKMDFEVVEAPPAVKGNTADGGSKQVTIETGVKVNVPLFIKTGDRIRVNTQTGEYSERAN